MSVEDAMTAIAYDGPLGGYCLNAFGKAHDVMGNIFAEMNPIFWQKGYTVQVKTVNDWGITVLQAVATPNPGIRTNGTESATVDLFRMDRALPGEKPHWDVANEVYDIRAGRLFDIVDSISRSKLGIA